MKKIIAWAVLIGAGVFALKDPKAAAAPVRGALGLVKGSAGALASLANSVHPAGLHYHVTPAGGEVIAVLLAILILVVAFKAITKAL
jgi:F0F1-type ATP synthase assembly protein I